ncbi:hypothetical protein AAJ76_400092187 [Vairimorpha ceranae]|uniref:Uncharacterized protein n=1 Tax=Vairimorpha ceranae TaxID=40302 RepID=A0A0F9YV99_9MICR|nr:hypothetical protein AAJ76_400092187 [Vairimorpha ceranae]KAF5141384.1 hypothetical protein G9O61_00g007010 [Vairimorpha ceranae]KKO76342.1 hypothetical protein AAJ76_400092187 [Vairimorpha ceranae]
MILALLFITFLIVNLRFVAARDSVEDTNETHIILRRKKHLFDPKEIYKVSVEYKWSREQFLTFLVVQKLQNILFNTRYKSKSVAEADLSTFKDGLNKAIEKMKEFSTNAFKNNIWDSTIDPELDEKINEILVKVKNYDLSGIKDSFNSIKVNKKPNSNLERCLHRLFTLSESEWAKVEYDVLLGLETEDYKYLFYKYGYGIKFHYDEVYEHKNSLFAIYCKLGKYLEKLSIIDIIFHDWSKYLLAPSIGYTWKFFHSKDIKRTVISSWEKYTSKKLDCFFTDLFDAAWRTHFTFEDHHPEHYKNKHSEEYKDDAGIIRIKCKDDMNARGLEEALIDMSGRNYVNSLKFNQASLKECGYLLFDLKFFDRFNSDDAMKILNEICGIINQELGKICEDYVSRRKEDDLRNPCE